MTLKFVHMTFVYTLAVLVGVHVAAALKHQLLDGHRYSGKNSSQRSATSTRPVSVVT